MAAAPCYLTEHTRDDALPTHRHAGAYASLVLRGGYLEASADGPLACEPGTLILHPAFHAHGNRFGGRGARVINLALPDALSPQEVQVLQVARLDVARRIFERGARGLPALLADAHACTMAPRGDWQDAFVQALADSDAPIAGIARRCGVSPAHASRALLASHGMPPQLLRRELRWRRALRLLRGDAALADIALGTGFADQSHFNRTVRAFTGLTPAGLRRQIKCVQDAAAAAGHPAGLMVALPRPPEPTPCAATPSPSTHLPAMPLPATPLSA